MASESGEPYPADLFRREDESDDRRFYAEPRLVVHIDEYAIAAIGEYLGRTLPADGVILDLMSSWRSHLPEGFVKAKLVGLGLNPVEMAGNPQLDERVVHDINADPRTPFGDDTFDAALVTVSIQYIVRPVEVFGDVHRTLKPGASFHVIYSNRCFPTKAVAIWRALNAPQQGQLIASYFLKSGDWETPQVFDISPRLAFYTDPVYVVTAKKKGEGA